MSHALTGKQVGLEPIEEGLWRMWFHRHWLGMWEPGCGRLWRPRQWPAQQARRCAWQGSAAGSLLE